MSALDVLGWVGAIALSLVMAAIALLVVWTVIQNIRGKGQPKSTRTAQIIGDATGQAVAKSLREYGRRSDVNS